MESQNTSHPRCGLKYPWEWLGRRSDDGEVEIGFNLLWVKIQGNLFKLASIQFEIVGEMILSIASFLIQG
jgi:hypothetical protein